MLVGAAALGPAEQALFDRAVFVFANPLAGEKGLGLLPVGYAMRAVAPLRVEGIGQRDFGRVAAVPAILGQARLLASGLFGEGRDVS